VRAVIALSIMATVGCGIDTAEKPSDDQVPVLDVALNKSYQPNKGLVLNLDEHGWPVRDGASMDTVILEARTFYDTLGSPGVTATAPMTFADWKTTFHIPARMAGESLEVYRQRADVVVYYNKNELGLGRELGCAEFPDGFDATGHPLTGVACYVTNYGTAFRDVVNSLPLAVEGLHPKNTVCISWRPSLPANYQVQFYTYNGDGDRREWAQLDTLGPRPLPQVCMNCHGGSYDNEKHLAKYARFLPMDPNVVVFAESGSASRASQEEAIRKLNLLSTKSPLTSAQTVMLDKLYGGKLAVAATKSATEWAPDAWNDTPEHRQLFDKVLKPNCTTCHAAMQNGTNGDVLNISMQFTTPALLNSGLPAFVCSLFTMPNSQATLLNFWEPGAAPLSFTDGKQYATAADLLLTQLDMTRDECTNLEMLSNCNRGPDPDALCGNAYSGRACNRVTGQCVPNLKAQRQPREPNGVCKTDGSRRCPYPEACVAMTGVPPGIVAPEGIASFDGVCMP
jgi:hypothetical protein